MTDGAQLEPYRCKHGCERDELKDRIYALEIALKRIAGGWPKPMQLARETLEKKK